MTTDRELFEAKTDTLAARIKYLYPKLAGSVGNSPHARGDAAKDFAEGLRQLLSEVGDFARPYIDEAYEAIGPGAGMIGEARRFQECLLEAGDEVITDFSLFADSILHSDEVDA